jgi:hypothetical protein
LPKRILALMQIISLDMPLIGVYEDGATASSLEISLWCINLKWFLRKDSKEKHQITLIGSFKIFECSSQQ